jgi:iron complex outermembrane receptor protein
MKLYKTKLALAASLIVAGNVYAQSLPNVIVTAKPDIAEVEIDKFSSTSAVITDETIRDLHAAGLRFLAITQLVRMAELKVARSLFVAWV